jgi:myo-inositol-1(or 4)-monophosphatase
MTRPAQHDSHTAKSRRWQDGGCRRHKGPLRVQIRIHPLHAILFFFVAAPPPQPMHPTLNIAIKAARRAAQIINRASLDVDKLTVGIKQQSDYVTEVDRAAEEAIIEVLREAYPSYGILAEESGLSEPAAESEFQWIIDPLDGTTNFIHGVPQYAISIGLAQKGVMTQAVVFDPNRNELFTASKGGGAFLNEKRMRVTKRTRLDEALIATGFPYRVFDHIDAYLAIFKEVAQKSAGMRRPGAASLDLAWVACGRMDGFWELGLSPWDVAAGSLLITEAGGLVSDLAGENDYMRTGNVVAGNPKVFAQLLQVIAPHRSARLSA